MEDSVSAVRVGQSKFGQGVFAGREFRIDEAVGRITGEVIDDPEHSSDFCMDLGDELTLEPGGPFRYLNHSCQPNCEIVQWESDEEDVEPEPGLWVHALREIQPEEELTIDYSWPAETAIPCGCGAERCRGWIVDPKEVEQLRKPAHLDVASRRRFSSATSA